MNNINPKANNSYINLLKNKNVLSWSLYDIADTVYFVGIIGIFLPLWKTEDMGGVSSHEIEEQVIDEENIAEIVDDPVIVKDYFDKLCKCRR